VQCSSVVTHGHAGGHLANMFLPSLTSHCSCPVSKYCNSTGNNHFEKLWSLK